MSKLTTRDVTDLDTLRHMMLLLREVRAREAGMEAEMDPVLGMYTMLETFLPPGSMEKEEVDKITVRPCVCVCVCVVWLRERGKASIHHPFLFFFLYLLGPALLLEAASQAGRGAHRRADAAAGEDLYIYPIANKTDG